MVTITVDALERSLVKHLKGGYLRPLSKHSTDAFRRVHSFVARDRRPLILDSGCGVGESTRQIGALNRDALVIGIDKSEFRLSKALRPTVEDNVIYVRANLIDFWRLAMQYRWSPRKHYLLYPNPWPKAKHLLRRWHAHPVFPFLLRLGGDIELRTNVKTYAQEFAFSLKASGVRCKGAVRFEALDPISPFERKYAARGNALYKVEAKLPRGEDH